MKKEIIEKVRLTADEGMTLTDGKNFGKIVFVAQTDSAENWHEITDEEAAKLQEEANEVE